MNVYRCDWPPKILAAVLVYLVSIILLDKLYCTIICCLHSELGMQNHLSFCVLEWQLAKMFVLRLLLIERCLSGSGSRAQHDTDLPLFAGGKNVVHCTPASLDTPVGLVSQTETSLLSSWHRRGLVHSGNLSVNSDRPWGTELSLSFSCWVNSRMFVISSQLVC